eukprot:COSAG01_NODE_6748_length_3517_cov_3.590111_1_plen_127_part_00
MQPQWVDWTGGADAAYNIPVHNGPFAPYWYHPEHNNPANAELNRRAEYARAVVEHQFGRIGEQWAIASDDSGPWHMVGLGGHYRQGQDAGMSQLVMYYLVCARLTAMTQRMRKSWPRDPDKFFRSE